VRQFCEFCHFHILYLISYFLKFTFIVLPFFALTMINVGLLRCIKKITHLTCGAKHGTSSPPVSSNWESTVLISTLVPDAVIRLKKSVQRPKPKAHDRVFFLLLDIGGGTVPCCKSQDDNSNINSTFAISHLIKSPFTTSLN
jgi:hypothetical protein